MTYTASCCAPSASPMPASLQQGCICPVHCAFPRAYRIMVPPGFLGLPGSLFLCLLMVPSVRFCQGTGLGGWHMLLSSLLEPRLSAGFLGHLVRAFSTAHSHFPREAKANMELLPSSHSNSPTQVISQRSSHQSP